MMACRIDIVEVDQLNEGGLLISIQWGLWLPFDNLLNTPRCHPPHSSLVFPFGRGSGTFQLWGPRLSVPLHFSLIILLLHLSRYKRSTIPHTSNMLIDFVRR